MDSSRTKLLVVLEATLGGIRRHVIDLLLALDAACYDITFVYSLRRADPVFILDLPNLEDKGITLIEIPMRREINPLFDISCLFRILAVVREIHPDLIHAHGAKAGALCRIAAAVTGFSRVVYTPHGGAFHKFSGVKGKLYLIVERLLATHSTQIICVSKNACVQAQRYLSVNESQVHLIYNGIDVEKVDLERENKRDARDKLGIDHGKLVVLFPALFVEAKGHLEFLEALFKSPVTLAPEILVLLAGKGPLQSRVEDRIEALGLQKSVQCVGFQTSLCRFYSACDLVILPSRSEALGYVLLEAMAFSKAIIATDVGGIPEAVEHGKNGEVLDQDALSRIAARLNHYNIHRDELALFGQMGRRIVESKFTLREMVSKTASLYYKVMQTLQ